MVLVLLAVWGLFFSPVAPRLWAHVGQMPGIVWLRQQVEAGERAPEEGANSEAIDEILQAGHMLQQEEQYQQALERFRQALELDETYAPTHVALANLYLQMGQQDKAVLELERAAELAPDDTFILSRLGELYMQQKELDKAVLVWKRVTELNPEDVMAHYWLGVAYHIRSYVDAEEAVQKLERAAELDAGQAQIYRNLAMAYVRRNDDYDEHRAIQAWLKVLELDPSQTDAYYYLGQLYMRTDQPQLAKESWEKYLAKGDDPEIKARVRELLQALDASTQ